MTETASYALAKYHLRTCWQCQKQEDDPFTRLSLSDGVVTTPTSSTTTNDAGTDNNNKLFVCGRCKQYNNPDPALYCSRECQRQHWKTIHRGKCERTPIEIQFTTKQTHRVHATSRHRHRQGSTKSTDDNGDNDGNNSRNRNKTDHDYYDWCLGWRKSVDGSLHYGDLELITWDYTDPTTGITWTWGGVPLIDSSSDEDDDGDDDDPGGRIGSSSVENLKSIVFEKECCGDVRRFLELSEVSFRWTCCGRTALDGLRTGCDHHGGDVTHWGHAKDDDAVGTAQVSKVAMGLPSTAAPAPCRCAFCHQGIPVPQILFEKKLHTQAAQGLRLFPGPDPRSSSLPPSVSSSKSKSSSSSSSPKNKFKISKTGKDMNADNGRDRNMKDFKRFTNPPGVSEDDARKMEAVYWGDDE